MSQKRQQPAESDPVRGLVTMNDQPRPLERDPRSKEAGDEYDVTDAKWSGSALLADEIEAYCLADPPMIEPYEPGRLRPASYQLTLGRELHLGGQHRILTKKEPLILEKHQVAVVSTRETIRVPRFLIARWSLRVTKIYEGLLWTGGPQVDPGWDGHLFCPIYNLAEREVELSLDDPLFTIDFTRTTGMTPNYFEMRERLPRTWFTPVRQTLSEHDSHRLHSAPYETLRDLSALTQFRNFATVALGVAFVALAAVIAALAAVAVEPTVRPGGPFLSFWPMTALVGSLFAVALSVGSIVGLIWALWNRRLR